MDVRKIGRPKANTNVDKKETKFQLTIAMVTTNRRMRKMEWASNWHSMPELTGTLLCLMPDNKMCKGGGWHNCLAWSLIIVIERRRRIGSGRWY